MPTLSPVCSRSQHYQSTAEKVQGKSDFTVCLDIQFSFHRLQKTIVIRRKGEFLYGVSPCLAALQANRRKIHAIYMKPGIAQKQGAVKA